jgi:isopentenyl diphosphate isomerase/L-lactate dehydrogenase-like FMN-dependent dehydrogenase
VSTECGRLGWGAVTEPPITLADVEELAAGRLDAGWYGYFAGGSGAERTLRRNVAAFDAVRLRQRVLTGIASVSTEASVLGRSLSAPIVVAPVAYQQMAHADGEEGMARAAAASGVAMCLSTFSTASPEAVAAAAPGLPRFLQVYVFRDRAVTDELIAQAVDAGYTAVFLTVDLPALGMRDRERRIHWTLPEDDLPAVQYAITRGAVAEGIDIWLDPTLDWSYLERLCSSARVPVVVKGVLEPEDAVRSAECGAAGVVVSNHGGRQLDGVPGTLDALPAVADAVGDRLEVFLDGGIRRGTDVLIARARGACAVLAGRLPLWGLAAGGEPGAHTVLELLREELAIALHLTGCRSLDEVDANVLATIGAP